MLLEQAVLIHLALSGGQFGSFEEREAAYALEDLLDNAIANEDAGELDGHDFGGNQCIICLYGPNADRIFEIAKPILKETPLASGGYAVKRYGEVNDPNSLQVRVTW